MMKKTVLKVLLLAVTFNANSQSITDNLYSTYLFSGNAIDLSMNNHHGIVIGATLTSDRNNNPNNAYSYNGTSSYIDFPTVFATSAPGSFTISWWLYSLKNDFANNQLVGKNSWGSFVFHTMIDGSVFVGTDINSRFSPAELPAGTVSLNEWQNFVFVFENGRGSFYKNGRLLATKTGLSNSGIWGGMTLGHPTGAYTINGYADDLAIWNRALNPNEVATISNPVITGNFSENIENSNNLVYPNPTSDKLFVSKKSENTSYLIFNALGLEVEKGSISGSSINVSQLDNGVYYLQLSGYGTTSRTKFIKQ